MSESPLTPDWFNGPVNDDAEPADANVDHAAGVDAELKDEA